MDKQNKKTCDEGIVVLRDSSTTKNINIRKERLHKLIKQTCRQDFISGDYLNRDKISVEEYQQISDEVDELAEELCVLADSLIEKGKRRETVPFLKHPVCPPPDDNYILHLPCVALLLTEVPGSGPPGCRYFIRRGGKLFNY